VAQVAAAKVVVAKVAADVQVAQAEPPAPQAAPLAVPGPRKEDPAAKKVRKSWEVKVWVNQGRDRPEAEVQREAEKQALQRARDEVREYLRQQSPALTWTPSVAYVRKHLVTGPVKRLADEDQKIKVPAGEFRTQRWVLPVAVTERQYQDMVRLDREARGGERMVLAGKVLGVLLLLLAGVMGYLRLDECCQGAYTRWLRLGLGGVLVGAAAGVWFLT
jgi:hypothetical protein